MRAAREAEGKGGEDFDYDESSGGEMAAEFQEFLAQKGRLKRLRDAGEHLPGESEGSAGGAWTEEGEGL